MSFSHSKNNYQNLDRVVLLGVRDITIAAYECDLVKAAEQISELGRLLALRNKKIFGSASEKSGRRAKPSPEYIDFEELKGKDDNLDVKPGDDTNTQCGNKLSKKRTYQNPHPGRRPIPAHIRREEHHIYPEGHNPSWGRELPPEITERLSLKIELFAEVLIHHKYAREGWIVMAPYSLK